MASEQGRWTTEMVHELPDDGNRYEVVGGALLVSPAPTWPHQAACRKLFLRIYQYLAAHAIGEAILAPADVEFDDRNMVEPDLFVAPLVEGRAPQSWQEAERLILAVEVVSPSTKRRDRGVKRRLYQNQGVPDYWIVDLDARAIECWRPTNERPTILNRLLRWQPNAGVPPLEIRLSAYFADVLGA
ncbi:MAG TPA: Uma2 family endonuclease [Gemmatimonadaceae bacterium]|nr:Uma2 family endonuclease [Gemmatimonadaceae bacterium]